MNRKAINRGFPLRLTYCFLTFLLLNLITGCAYYFKVETKTRLTPEDIRWEDFNKKYFILHSGESAMHLSAPEIKENRISGNLSVLPKTRLQYEHTDPLRSNKYKRTEINQVLDQVHLYLQKSLVSALKNGDNINLDFSAIQKMEIYKKDKSRTTTSWVVPITVGIVGGAAVVGIIAAATKSSCPLVYVKKDSSYAFSGEIFGGAIYSSLERHDYLPLPGFEPSDGRYELKITNGLPEIQYINLAELWIVSHPENLKVLPDRKGVIRTIGRPEAPAEAVSLAGSDVLPLIKMNDRSCFQFNEEPAITGDTCAFNTVFLTFAVPENADTGKLVVNAGNSMWSDYSFGELTKLFGNRYEEFIKWQGKRPPDKTIQWRMDQRFALMVYVETSTGWRFIDYFDLIGPLGARDMVMPVGLAGALFTTKSGGERSVRIKLESGFKFWDLDYAAMDFSKDLPCRVDVVQPASAITEKGIDVKQQLSKNDTKYYIQEKIGEEGLIVYQETQEVRGMQKSVFLHTKGYYTHVRNYPNPPDKEQLNSFLIPGRFSRFSFDNYSLFTKNKMVLVSEPNVP